MMEEWRDITGYEGLYQVSSYGRVKSLERMVHRPQKGDYLKKERLIKGWMKPDRHIAVELCGKVFYLHQLVAQAFIPNPNNHDVVHHLDHNPQNNMVDNLVWMSDEEHKKLHAEELGVQFSKKVYQYTLADELIKVWNSVIEAGRGLEINQGSISNCCNGRCNTYKGYKWSYDPL